MAANQGQILVSAHLYNAVQQAGGFPEGLQWADMDWVIEQQGSDWMFMDEKPKQGLDFGKHVNLVLGYPAHKFSKSHNSRKPGLEVQKVIGGSRRLTFHARRCELGIDREPRHKKPVGDSKAKKDILVMLESLDKHHQEKSLHTGSKLSSLQKLCAFKIAIAEDEPALAFDVMDLNLRCIRLLQQVQKYAFTIAPLDYSASLFTGGLTMTAVIADMLYDLDGFQRHHPSIFPVVATILRKVVQKEGDAVLEKAKVWQEEMKIELRDVKGDDEPSFENPYEDIIDLDFRNLAKCIILSDANGDCRVPSGLPQKG